jgi:hypothetical protein
VSAKLELIVVAGPMKGERFALPPDRSTKIGRHGRGVNLTQDEQLSLEHAEIYPRHDKFWIVDLQSHTGTFVNGLRLGDAPAQVDVGAVIEVGGTVLRVVDVRARTRAIGLLVALGVPLLTTVLMQLWFASRPIVYDPELVSSAAVRQRVRVSERVPVPIDFVRDQGVDHRGMWLRRVSDYDQDGVDELWLRYRNRDKVVTFGDRGDWQIIGDLPVGCVERDAPDFPDQACNGLLYQFHDGKYQPAGVDGIIAWAHPWKLLNPGRDEPARYGPGRLQPYRMTLKNPERLKGFLVERGIDEPIHYLICGEGIAGLKAQVLTQNGEVETLDYGCLGGLRLITQGAGDELGSQKPQAFALTVTGYDALIRDVTAYLSGEPAGLFLDNRQQAVINAFTAAPTNRASVRVSFLADPVEGALIAEEGEQEPSRSLTRSGLAATAPLPTAAVEIRHPGDGPGVADLDPPGCGELRVETWSWHCKLLRWCLPGRTFLTVRQVGCGPDRVLVQVPYAGGRYWGGDAHVDVSATVDAVGGGGQIDVLRARIAYRGKTVPEGEDDPP